MLLEDGLIAQTEIAREIDGFDDGGQAWNYFHRLPMRERKENALSGGELFKIVRRLCKGEIRQSIQIAMNFANRFACLLIRSYKQQLNIRMEQQNAQQLRA